MKAADSNAELPPEAWSRTFEQAMDLWVRPEIERRRNLGLIDDVFELSAAQVIMREGKPLEVRLNQEIVVVARMKVATHVRAGDAVNLADVEAVNEILLTDADADAAHLTMINLNGDWSLAFDFRYNATKARRVMEVAHEFLATAEEARKAGRIRAAIDSLFSAVELMATAELLLLPVEGTPRDGRYKHQYVQMVVNKRGKSGFMSTSAESATALNQLTNLRHTARYQLEPFEVPDLAELFEHARYKHDWITESLPERVAVDPGLLKGKPKPPPKA
jgi:hypothetical protein